MISVPVIALVLGIAAHILKQAITTRRTGNWPGCGAYLVVFWPETLLAALCSTGLFLGLPALAHMLPFLGDVEKAMPVIAFFCGYAGNSLADLIGDRIQNLAGGR